MNLFIYLFIFYIAYQEPKSLQWSEVFIKILKAIKSLYTTIINCRYN